MTEPGAGSDLQGIKTTAKKDGNHYVLNGSKTFITNGQHANLIIVVSKTDPTKGAKGVSLMLVETDEVEGFRRGRNLDKVGLKSNDTSELFFDDVRIPTANMLGTEEGQGFAQLMTELPQERLLIANQGISMIERALAITIDYVKDRKAFWQGDHRVPEHPVQAGRTEVGSHDGAGLRQSLHWRAPEGTALIPPPPRWPNTWFSDLQCKVVDECVQLHGGYGYMNEYPVGADVPRCPRAADLWWNQ